MSTVPDVVPSERALGRLEPGELLADAAYRSIRRALLSGELAPGSPLSVPELARRLEISRSPVREAVQRLIADGVATAIPRRGAVVSEIAASDLNDLFEVREPLEGLAARRAAERVDDEGRAGLRALLEAHAEMIGRGDVAAQVELDMAYHRAVREIGANAELNVILDRIQMRSHLALISLWSERASSQQSLDEHRAIFAVVSAGDPDAADGAARAHVRNVRRRIAGTP